MNYDLIELAKRCPDLAITVRLSDLVEANKGLIEETKRELEHSLEASKSETYLTREKVMEMLEVSPTTLWRWEKCGYLIPISIGSKRPKGSKNHGNKSGRTDGPIPNGSEVSEVVFSDAENLPLVASLCRWQRCKAVMPDPIGHPESRNL